MTDIQICNLALARLGDSRITALTDATAQAQYCSLFYTQTVEELQAEFDWQFCRKQVSLTSGTAPLTGYSTQYALPTDFIRAIRLGNIDASENFGTWEIVGTNLHTNLTSPVALDYIANITTTTSFPAIFTELLSIKLAAVLAMPLTGSKDLFTQLAEVYGATLQKPAFLHATERVGRQRTANAIATQADIVRLAILKTGTADGYKPGGQPAILGNSFYDQSRDELLSEFDWAFARATPGLTADVTPPYGSNYTQRFPISSSILAIHRVNGIAKFENFGVWEVVGDFIHTNFTTPLLLNATERVTDITKFPAIFIDLLANKIAMRLAMTNGDSGRMEILAKETEFIFQKPGFANAIEQRSAPARTTAALSVTEICRQAILRIGTVDSFKPFGEPMVLVQSLYNHTLEELLSELPWAFAKKQISVSANATDPTQGYSKRYALPTDFIQLLRVNNIDTTENFGQWEIVGGFIHSDLGGGFSVGEEVQFTNLPAGSNLSSTATYLISANPSNTTFNISDANGNGIALSNTSITANVTEVSSTSGTFTAKISSLVSGIFTYTSPQNLNIKLDYTANITDVALFPAPFVEALIARITTKVALPLTGNADIANAMATIAAESLNRPTIQVLVEKSSKPRATSSANSVVEICRQAILRVGSADQFKPYGEPMVIAQSLYEQTRNEVLADFDWQFARIQSSITADATPPAFGYTTRYALPIGTLKVLRVNGVDEDENFGNWEIVGGFLHTNYTTPVKIETTKIIEDTKKFPPVFTNMLTVTLAFKLSQLLEIQVAKN